MTTPTLPRPGRATGPRTLEGKAISSRNAWRHGLSIPIRADPLWRPAVIALERELARDGAAPRAFVRQFAEAVVELSRIARAQEAFIGGADGEAWIDATRRLDRYQGRAHAKKWKALRLYPSYWLPGRASEGAAVPLRSLSAERTRPIEGAAGDEVTFRKTNSSARPRSGGGKAAFRKT